MTQRIPVHQLLLCVSFSMLIVTITACGGGSSSSSSSVSDNTDDTSLPTISGTPPDAIEDEPYSFTPEVSGASDFEILNQPSWLGFNTDTGEIFGTPTNNDVGTTQDVTIRVSNENGTVELVVDVTVVNVNDPPTLTGTPPEIAPVGQSFSFELQADDIDEGDLAILTFGIMDAPSWITLDDNGPNPIVSGTPTIDDLGIETITVTADDGKVESPTEFTFTIEVVNAVAVDLMWDNPTTFADGSPLDPADLAGFELCFTREGGTEECKLVQDPGGINSFTTEPLPLGTYTFTVKVFETSTDLSDPSNELNAVF